MALPKQSSTESQAPDDQRTTRLLGPVARLRQIHEDLLKYAPPDDEDDGWDELARALDAERPEGRKLFPPR